MSTFLLSTILISMLFLAVMIIYVIDKIHSIEKHSRRVTGGGVPPAPADERFAALEGEQIWQALAGMPAEGWDAQALDELRKLYEPVLLRHIGELLEEGMLDARQGIQVKPNDLRAIKTTHGQVLSWIPPEEARRIYDLGQDRLRAGEDNLPAIRARLDETCDRLFASLGLSPAQSASRILLPGSEPAPAPAPPGSPAMSHAMAPSIASALAPAFAPALVPDAVTGGVPSGAPHALAPVAAKADATAPVSLDVS